MIEQTTLKDLELEKVKDEVIALCRSEKGREAAGRIRPYTHNGALLTELKQTDEFLSSFTSNNAFPNLDFDAADPEIRLLGVENSYLSAEGFSKIRETSRTVNEVIDFLEKFKEYYPNLILKLKYVYKTAFLVESVDAIIDADGTLRDDASPELLRIRRSMSEKRGSIDHMFSADLSRYRAAGYLDDIMESVIDHRRVLAVDAAQRRKVKGSFVGTSRTGSIVFIEPESTARLNRELMELEMEEKQEIIKILRAATDQFRPHVELVKSYQRLLTDFDVIRAKANYARQLNACLPEITRSRSIDLKEAYHPLLLKQNKDQGRQTFPQDIRFEKNSRIISISGPNAGGKSITLKTIGLLQVMLQCGMLVPVHSRSRMSLFETVITDIGDNQSIENHLSTYSYRLKNMSRFLKVCNENTLFLIDEFGTGSDPELGGALAEVFLEDFYRSGCFGVLTTHYTNIKLLVESLPEAINASMLFDEQTLQPLYKLFVGQAGSSFTFEVAQINGIPQSLIERAKGKVEQDKIVLERTIAKLQKEKAAIESKSKSLSEAQTRATTQVERLEKTNEKISDKLGAYQELFDRNTKRIQFGKKFEALADGYFFKKMTKKQVLTEFVKMVEVENAKKADKKKTVAESKNEQKMEKIIEKQIEKEIAPIREEKQKQQEEALAAGIVPSRKANPGYVFKVGDKVRIEGGFACGVIERIEKGRAKIDYGWFTTEVALEELDLVVAAKPGSRAR